ncbi:hypothetical protein FRC03_004331 [Tulasnella sp. 419]|nr:hypothetical protein FRC03_004331 [Tulasnella sp. 419]
MSNVPDISHLNLDGKIQMGKLTFGGGYSDIFRGALLLDGKSTEVAIKALRIRAGNDIPSIEERLRKRFYREVLLWRDLRHPRIVPLLGYIMLSDGPPTLVSPWYINGNLSQYLKTNPNSDRNTLTLDVAHGIEYLHSIPVAHGDLKPANVLVNHEGRASLCDFGMSQFVEETSRITGFTTTNANLGGTDRYMCPELFEDDPKSLATDMWALGCLVAQILTDELPYQQFARRQALAIVILRGQLPMTNANGAVDTLLWDCLTKCWSFNPGDRPTAGELVAHLQPSPKAPTFPGLSRSFMTKSPFSSEPCIELSPDGRFLATASDEGVIMIWDTQNNALAHLATWKWPIYGSVHRVSWSFKGYLCVESSLSTVAGEIETGEVFWQSNSNCAVNFTSGGGSITFIDNTNRVYFRNPNEKSISKVKIGLGARCMAFTSQNKKLLVADAYSQTLSVYGRDAASVESIVSLSSSKCRGISISTEDTCALVSYDDWEPQVWSMSWIDSGATLQLSLLHQYSLPSQISHCTKAQFGGPKDELVVALCGVETICLWNRETAELLHSFPIAKPHQSADMSFRWNSNDPNEIILAVSTWTYAQIPNLQTLEIWKVSPSEKGPISDHSSPSEFRSQISGS